MLRINFFSKAVKNTTRPVVLLMLDGFGIAPESAGNPIAQAKTPNLNYLKSKYLYGLAIAAGESVGLPANEAGNSEVGHLTVGAGRVVDQSLVRINKSIENGTFYTNDAFRKAIGHIKQFNSRLHIMGMVGSGSVHSSNEHLKALIELAKRAKLTDCAFHLFTDGRDSPPTDGITVIKELDAYIQETGVGRISTITGRYYAMDRDARWERTKLIYDAITIGKSSRALSSQECMQKSYDAGKTDEFIAPTVIGEPILLQDNDAIIFFNFRIDRPRQLTMAFVLPDFEHMKGVEFGYLPHENQTGVKATDSPTFVREKRPQNVYFVTMTEYQKNLPVSDIAFPPPLVINSLPEVVSKSGFKQFHLAESEKERMVTFYMDGLSDHSFEGEDTKIVPSPKIATYDKKPEMSVNKIVKEFKKALRKDLYSLFIINFANPDMVAHTGNINATLEAIRFTDQAVGEIARDVLSQNGVFIITADHGNAEELLTYNKSGFYFAIGDGNVNTEHSNNPVPVYIAGNGFEADRYNLDRTRSLYDFRGALQDIAPTVLHIMNIPKPPEMTGQNLLQNLTKRI